MGEPMRGAWLAVAQAAAELALHRSTVYRLVETNQISHHKIGGGERPRIRFSVEDIKKF